MIPSGTVTLLFTDIEGSTRLWDAHPDEMRGALARHDDLVRGSVEAAGGYVFKTVGDAFCSAFVDAFDAVRAAVDAQRALAAEPWPDVAPIRVRMGLHSGVCEERDGDYFGQPVNRVARLEATAHGGQIVVSATTLDLLGARRPSDVSVRDLGEHRLKDLGRPERVFQVCVDGMKIDFPPLRSLSNPALATNLPEQISSFVGRDRELAEVRELLQSARLVTLTGPGGVGKTRVALQAAAQLVDGSGDGVWFVELAALPDGDLVAGKVATVLHVREEAGRPMLETLVDAVRDRDTLVVLDNCEHVIDAAAKLADALLGSCPRIQLLATSREPLGVAGEHAYAVPSLGLPDAEADDVHALSRSEAVWLFVERARQRKTGFALDAVNSATVARICRRLDGIPLAIELAAARVGSLALADLESRLDQRFQLLTGGVRTALPRQQTLRALIDWSWDLLTAGEQVVLARLAVFADGWDLEAAEAVAAADVDGMTIVERGEVVDHLRALVDKSLVLTDETTETVRFRLLETVRDYALARLDERGADGPNLRVAHRDHYLALAARAEPHLVAHGQAEWLDRLELDHENLRAALATCMSDPDPRPGLQLATTLRRFWSYRGHAVEGIEILTELLARPDAQTPDLLRGNALATLGGLETDMGNPDAGAARCDEALAIGRARHDDLLVAKAQLTLSSSAFRRGQFAAALAHADAGLALARAQGDADVTAALLNSRGVALDEHGDDDGGRACYHEARDIFRKTGNRIAGDRVVGNLAYSALACGDLDAARASLTELVSSLRARHDPSTFAIGLFNLGLVELLDDDKPSARALFAETLTSARGIGNPSMVAYALFGIALTGTDDDPERAATLHGAADALLDQCDMLLDVIEAGLRDADHAHLRAALGDARYEVAYETGRGLTREEAVAIAAPAP